MGGLSQTGLQGGMGGFGRPQFASPQQQQQNPPQWPTGPNYASLAARYSSTTPALSTPQGFIPPPGGYGVPTTTLQQVSTPYPPASLSGNASFQSATPPQQAGFSPLQVQPNYNLMMGGTTGYKNPTMK
ncbi:MAG TPA: hypothetical protein VKD24_07150 [Candidatus Angelobacter sp.]|nr:hypothetical protein [Candidatus Angelobacter sp.]